MNLRSLQYLVAVADEQHFGRAARKCFVSQPTLSMQLKKLEDRLGVQLIERNNRQVMVTEIGRDIAEQARQILQGVKQIRDSAKQVDDPFAGELSFGVIPTLAPYVLPLMLPAFAEQFPKLTLHITESKTEDLIKQLQQGRLDCILLALPIDHVHQFSEAALFEEPFYLAVSRQHALAKQPQVALSDLQGQTLSLLDEGHCLRGQALEVCQSADISEDLSFRATSLETLRGIVAANLGVTLMPKLACNMDEPHVAYLPFADNTPARTIGMLWRKTSVRTQLLAALVQLIKAEVGCQCTANQAKSRATS